MERLPYANEINNAEGRACAASRARYWGWLCPLFTDDPIGHLECASHKLGRVSDVRQHLKRRHQREWEMLETKTEKQNTEQERWNALWDDIFPGKACPATPYAGTELAVLLSAAVKRYEQSRAEDLSVEGRVELRGLLAHVQAWALDKRLGNVSGQRVSDVNDHQSPGIPIQEVAHQHLSPPTYPAPVGLYDQPYQPLPGSPFVFGQIFDVPMLDATPGPQGSFDFEANGPHSASSYQLSPHPWMVHTGSVIEYVECQTAPFDATDASGRDGMGVSHDGGGGGVGLWGFSQASEDGYRSPK